MKAHPKHNPSHRQLPSHSLNLIQPKHKNKKQQVFDMIDAFHHNLSGFTLPQLISLEPALWLKEQMVTLESLEGKLKSISNVTNQEKQYYMAKLNAVQHVLNNIHENLKMLNRIENVGNYPSSNTDSNCPSHTDSNYHSYNSAHSQSNQFTKGKAKFSADESLADSSSSSSLDRVVTNTAALLSYDQYVINNDRQAINNDHQYRINNSSATQNQMQNIPITLRKNELKSIIKQNKQQDSAEKWKALMNSQLIYQQQMAKLHKQIQSSKQMHHQPRISLNQTGSQLDKQNKENNQDAWNVDKTFNRKSQFVTEKDPNLMRTRNAESKKHQQSLTDRSVDKNITKRTEVNSHLIEQTYQTENICTEQSEYMQSIDELHKEIHGKNREIERLLINQQSFQEQLEISEKKLQEQVMENMFLHSRLQQLQEKAEESQVQIRTQKQRQDQLKETIQYQRERYKATQLQRNRIEEKLEIYLQENYQIKNVDLFNAKEQLAQHIKSNLICKQKVQIYTQKYYHACNEIEELKRLDRENRRIMECVERRLRPEDNLEDIYSVINQYKREIAEMSSMAKRE